MKNILFFTSKIENSGGTERASIAIANYLAEYGYNIFFFNLIGDEKPFFPIHDKIIVNSLNLDGGSTRKNFLLIIYELRKFIKDNKVDVVVDVDTILTVFSFFSLVGIKVKHIAWEHFNWKVNLGVRFRNIGRRIAARYCDNVITLTNQDKQFWIEESKILNAKITVIANPSPFYTPNHTPDIGNKTVLAIGHLVEVKGFDMLIEAWSIVCDSIKGWRLLIVGSGEEEVHLKLKAKNLSVSDKITFISATKDIEKYYQSSSIYALSSRSEGLPMVLIEAQSFGLPIVAFDCDTGPSDIIINKQNGILVPCYNVRKFADSLIEIMSFDQSSYQSYVNSAKFFSTRYESKEIINQWIRLFDF